MIQLTKKMHNCARSLAKGLTDTDSLAKKWGCNFWTAQFRIKRLKEIGVIEAIIARDQNTGKFNGIEIIKINSFTLKGLKRS